MSFSDLSVLTVDDDAFSSEVLDAVLRDVGVCEVHSCSSGSQVLASISVSGTEFDVAICDLQMPEMDGIELLRHLAEFNFSGGIILYSGVELRLLKSVETLALELNLMVLGILTKPVKPQDLSELLGRYEGQHQKVIDKDKFFTREQFIGALKKGEIVTWYQPQIDLNTDKLVSVEAIARWVHPEYGVLVGNDFIPYAKSLGLLESITEVIYKQAMAFVCQSEAFGLVNKISVNVGVDSLSHLIFADQLERWTLEAGVQPERVVLEVPEVQLIENLPVTLDVLTRLCLKGFSLSIDDFGKGYSSVKQLMDIPFEELKIDWEFVHGSQFDKARKAAFKASVELGKKLNMRVVAEGVENMEDYAQAKRFGCDVVQGYLISPALPYDDFFQWICQEKLA